MGGTLVVSPHTPTEALEGSEGAVPAHDDIRKIARFSAVALREEYRCRQRLDGRVFPPCHAAIGQTTHEADIDLSVAQFFRRVPNREPGWQSRLLANVSADALVNLV